MFSFFKKKAPEKKAEEVIILSDEQIAKFQSEINNLKNKLETSNQSNKKEVALIYEQLGLKQAELLDNDGAIISLEKSLQLRLSMGEGYKKLMSLYNQKRAEAAKKGDDEGIDYYMTKMDKMRQIAKKVTISGE